jgi:hypothetical protein
MPENRFSYSSLSVLRLNNLLFFREIYYIYEHLLQSALILKIVGIAPYPDSLQRVIHSHRATPDKRRNLPRRRPILSYSMPGSYVIWPQVTLRGERLPRGRPDHTGINFARGARQNATAGFVEVKDGLVRLDLLDQAAAIPHEPDGAAPFTFRLAPSLYLGSQCCAVSVLMMSRPKASSI